VNKTFWITAALLSTVVFAGGARADLVTYSFNGTDSLTGSLVVGTLSYSTTAAVSDPSSGESKFTNVDGSLSITFDGKTYSSSSISATLQSGSLQFYNSDTSSGHGLSVLLAAANAGSIFNNLSSLPTRLSTSNLLGSTFSITQFPAPPGHGQAGSGAIFDIAGGSITSVDFVSDAATPEPSSLALAALGAFGLGVRIARRKTSR
jgi:PEP-CTERM motif